MLDALERLRADVESGAFLPAPDDEDVHTALERGLIERAGADVGGRLRAGRSRNDQIATLFRMYLREHARVVAGLVLDVVDALVEQSTRHLGVAMPGRTHLQHAQPVLLSHHLLAHAWALLRDVDRLRDWDARTAVSPYGSGALAGSSLGLDPEAVAADLGFDGSVENSIDGTASRDFVAEFAFVAAMTAVDISRLAEEVVLWATKEFSFVTLDDAYSTGSSIMPQKKNPDVAELARGQGRSPRRRPRRAAHDAQGPPARVQPRPPGGQGAGLRRRRHPRGPPAGVQRHGRDDGVRHRRGWSRSRRRASRSRPTSPSGSCARACRSAWPTRSPARACGGARSAGVELWDLTDADLAELSPHLTPGVRDVLSVEGSMASRSAKGGTAPVRVAEQLERVVATAADHRAWSAVQPTVR